MTKYARDHNVGVLFVAGDGLALMRLNHLLKNKPHMYIDSTPVVIPIQGAHTVPHSRRAPAGPRAPQLITGQLITGRTACVTVPAQVSIRTGSSISCMQSGASIGSSSCGALMWSIISRLSRTRASRNSTRTAVLLLERTDACMRRVSQLLGQEPGSPEL